MNRYSRVHAEIDLDAILHNMDAMRGNIAAARWKQPLSVSS